jgi:hypothetical protein
MKHGKLKLWAFSLLPLSIPGVIYGESSSGFILGSHLEYGVVSLKSDARSEIDKSGNATGLNGFMEIPTESYLLHFGLGYDKTSIKGTSKTLNIKQKQNSSSVFVEGGCYFNFSDYLMPGLDLRISTGKGANFSVIDREKNNNLYQAGPGVRFAFPQLTANLDLTGTAAYLISFGDKDRHVKDFVVGIGLSYRLGQNAEKNPPSSSESQPPVTGN